VLKIWEIHLAAKATDPAEGAYSTIFHNLEQVLCRFIQSTDIMIAFNW